MPDFFDDLMEPTTPAKPNSLAVTPPTPVGGDFFDNLMAPQAPSPAPSPTAQAPKPPTATAMPGASPMPALNEEPTWWDQNGKLIEGAAAAGLGLMFGPRLARGMGKIVGHTGAPGEAVQQGAKNLQAIIAPSTVSDDAGRAANITRQETGLAAQKSAQVQADLEPFWQAIGASPDPAKRQFISYVEGRSAGTQLQDKTLQPLADRLKKAYADVHMDMGDLNEAEKTGFVQDYYRHQWVRDENSARIFGKEGNKSFTKQRTIPTIEEGIAKGLTPKSLDPVQTTLEYVTNARRFIASNKIIQTGQDTGDVIFRKLGDKSKFPTDDTWVPIEGSLGRKGGGQLYAKEGWGRVYNNWRSAGFTGAAGDVLHSLRRTSNTITGLELGLSGFHFTTMVNEAIINDVAKSITNFAQGKFGQAAKDLIKSPAAPVRLAKLGGELERTYLGKAAGTPEMRKMSELLTAAGGRGKGSSHAQDYEYTAMGSFWRAWKRGALASEGKKYLNDIAEQPVVGTAKAVGSVIGRTMQTVMEPLFNHYIPKLKNGAFYDTMGQWLAANPAANKAAQIKQAQVIWDSIDNRFGESVNDNIFWKQHMKQVAMLSMRSYSWNVGTIREIGGGIKDIASHELTPRAAYVIALPIVYGTIGALYQKMKTGEYPNSVEDYKAPRTGGTDPATGLPERMIMPGYMKDVFGWMDNPGELAKHKLSTFITTAGELASGKDWRGAPIAPPTEGLPFEESAPAWLNAYMGHVAGKVTPISMRDLMRGEKQGTNLTVGERLLGMNPGGRKYVDPEGMKAYKRYRELKDWNSKKAFDDRQDSYYGGVD